MIREHEGIDVDLAQLPARRPGDLRNDPEGRHGRNVPDRESRADGHPAALKPATFYDLVVEIAIIRPGPIVGQMVHPYLNRRAGREPVTYPHPSLEPILKRTLGVPLFQEQLLRIAMTAAGFSGGEAEELRRAMGFKRSVERMQQIEARLRSGMDDRGITGAVQDQIILHISSFALYGFPESHSASFALIAYASSYLKCHHPAAFLAGLLNAWPMGFYNPATLVKDAQRHGVDVRPIDVTRSSWKCVPSKAPTRFASACGLQTDSAAGTGEHIEVARALAPFAEPRRPGGVASRCTRTNSTRSPNSARWRTCPELRTSGALRCGKSRESSATAARCSQAKRPRARARSSKWTRSKPRSPTTGSRA